MSTVLSISASPQQVSSTHALLTHVNRRVLGAGHTVRTLQVRDLPARALLSADLKDPTIAEAIAAVADADAIIVATPVYQAAYSGLLKVFLDLLPQFAFRGKAVLPIVTGGSPAHVLAVDYALRPVLANLGAAHVGQGWFVPVIAHPAMGRRRRADRSGVPRPGRPGDRRIPGHSVPAARGRGRPDQG